MGVRPYLSSLPEGAVWGKVPACRDEKLPEPLLSSGGDSPRDTCIDRWLAGSCSDREVLALVDGLLVAAAIERCLRW